MVTINFDQVITGEQLLTAKKYSISAVINNDVSKGLYFFYDKDNRLLYIGWASYLSERIGAHIKGKSSNTKKFYKDIHALKILYESSFNDFFEKYPECNDIEFYMIEKLDPKYNIVRSKEKAYK